MQGSRGVIFLWVSKRSKLLRPQTDNKKKKTLLVIVLYAMTQIIKARCLEHLFYICCLEWNRKDFTTVQGRTFVKYEKVHSRV